MSGRDAKPIKSNFNSGHMNNNSNNETYYLPHPVTISFALINILHKLLHIASQHQHQNCTKWIKNPKEVILHIVEWRAPPHPPQSQLSLVPTSVFEILSGSWQQQKTCTPVTRSNQIHMWIMRIMPHMNENWGGGKRKRRTKIIPLSISRPTQHQGVAQ